VAAIEVGEASAVNVLLGRGAGRRPWWRFLCPILVLVAVRWMR
jgi:hypothetical protein